MAAVFSQKDRDMLIRLDERSAQILQRQERIEKAHEKLWVRIDQVFTNVRYWKTKATAVASGIVIAMELAKYFFK
jgi:hypothetical protein